MKQSWFLLKGYECPEFLCPPETFYWMMLVSLIVFLCLLFPAVKRAKQLQAIPGPGALIILAKLLKFSLDGTINSGFLQTTVSLAHIFEKTGLCRIWVGYIPAVLIYKAETMERLLSSDDTLDRVPEYQFGAPAFKNGLFTCPANQWRQRRKLLNPAFNARIVEECMPIFNKQSAVFVKKIKSMLTEMPVNVAPLLQHCTLDIICDRISLPPIEAAMGVDIGSQLGKNTEFVQATHELVSSTIMVSRKKEMLKDSQLIENRSQEDQSLPSRKKLGFLDLLLYYQLSENKLTENDVLGEVSTFLVAGHDTSGLTLSWALFLIGHDPRVQENIHSELDEVFAGDKERPITLADIKELPYLKCVIQETLRLYPPGSYIARIATNDLVIDGYTIPSGTRCVGLIYQLHRDPRYFPKPEAFIPERFMSNSRERHPYSYVPFSSGPKVCIGQRFAMNELLTILADVLRNFSVKSADARDKISVSLEFVLAPSNPLRVTFTPR